MNLHDLAYSYQPPYRLIRHIGYWLFWLGFYGLVNASYHQSTILKWSLFELLTMVVKLPYAYFLAYYLFPKLIPQKRYIALVFWVITLAFLGMVALMFLYQLFPYEMPGTATDFLSFKTVYMMTDLIYIASPVVLIKMTQNYIKQEKNAARLYQEKIEAELKILKNQLQPHFLFNNLNNIYSMVLSKDDRADGALLKLSDILSYMLYDCNVERIALQKEIDLIKNYISLEKLKYEDRLEVSFEVMGEVSNKLIAPLLLLPFVENAFKHGVAKSEKKSWVRIFISLDNNYLQYLVENSLTNNTEQELTTVGGIGLSNVRKRLNILYPQSHTLVFQQIDSFLIKMTIEL
ncbi:MAG: histidine kinase [Cyclobacteriaceae bacterium]|nr:histidine kinase [Cyclobacteriaceae bacterium]